MIKRGLPRPLQNVRDASRRATSCRRVIRPLKQSLSLSPREKRERVLFAVDSDCPFADFLLSLSVVSFRFVSVFCTGNRILNLLAVSEGTTIFCATTSILIRIVINCNSLLELNFLRRIKRICKFIRLDLTSFLNIFLLSILININ